MQSKFLPILAMFWAAQSSGQTLSSKEKAFDEALFSKDGKLVLFGNHQLKVLDSGSQVLFDREFPKEFLSDVAMDGQTVLFRQRTLAEDQWAEQIMELDLMSLALITSERKAYDPSSGLNAEQDLLQTIDMEDPIRHMDTNPWDSSLVASVSRKGLQLNHPATDRKYLQKIQGVQKAFFIDLSRLLIVKNEEAFVYRPSTLVRPKPLAAGVQDIVVNEERSKFCLLMEDRTEIWEMQSADDQIATISLGPGAVELIASLEGEAFDTYLLFKEEIDDEIALKDELFTAQAKSESQADFDDRKEDGQKHFQEIIDHYTGFAKAISQTINKVVEIQGQTQLNTEELLQHKADSLQSIDDERQLLLTAERVKKSYQEYSTKIESVGAYDTENEQYTVSIDGEQVPIKINLAEARSFKLDFEEHLVVGAKQLDKTGKEIVTLGYQVMTPNGDVFKSLDYQEPLFVPKEQRDRLLTKQLTRGAGEDPAVTQSTTKFSKFLYNKIKTYDYHALIIGVNDYAHESVVDLDNPINDGQLLQKVLTERYRFSEDNITFLENPTRADIIDSFDNLSSRITEQDNLLVFYAGHGIWDKNLQQGYWLPSDAKSESKAAWLSNSTIRDYITGIKSKHTLLIADACFSGGIFKTREVFVGETLGFANIFKLSSRKAITSGNLTPVQDISVFMKYFLKTLRENESPLLAAEELFSSVKIPVANNNMSGQVPQYGDILNAGDEGGDFVFILEQDDEDL